jgi:LmbE family N-acetylglucosaminyl deacetylase
MRLATLGLLIAALLRPVVIVADEPPGVLEIGKGTRLLVVAPHPDDETLGAGGLLQRTLEHGGKVWVVLVTAGDGYVEAVVHETGQPRPRPSEYVTYGQRRLHEARAALRLLGGKRVHLEFLGFPDGGLHRLLTTHWQRSHPERSQTTAASDPPYAEALEPDVPYDGADLRRELVNLLRKVHPTMVVLPDPLDRHPDHRAAGLFTLLAVQDWAAAVPLPRLLAYLVHWPDWPPGWNDVTLQPQAMDARLDLPRAFPRQASTRVELLLTVSERAHKHDALAQYASQREVIALLLAAFVRRTEPFSELSKADLDRIPAVIEHHSLPNGTRPQVENVPPDRARSVPQRGKVPR